MRPMSALFAAALLLAAAGCQQPPGPAEVGGWEKTSVTGEVREAAEFAAGAIPSSGAKLVKVENASTQVVAGLNFAFDLTLADGSRWHVLVWRKVDGSFALTEAEKIVG